MVSKAGVDNILSRVKQLCHSQGFVQEIVSKHITKYGFGPAGTLLRGNIRQEWYKTMVTTQGNTYMIEEPTLWPCEDVSSETVWQSNQSSLKYSLKTTLSDGCLSHYLRLLELNNQRFPFSISQIGVYQNTEPNDTFLLRSQEQTGLILQYFSPPSLSTQSFDNWQRSRLKWWRQYSQHPSRFSVSDITSESGLMKAHIQYDFSWGKDSIETVTNRGDLDIREMEVQAGLSHQGKHGRKPVFPIIIECLTSLEKAMLAFVVDAFSEKEKTLTKDSNKEMRMVLRINRCLAPYKVAMAISGPGGRELKEVSNHMSQELRSAGIDVFDAFADSNLSLENRVTRFDELGIPFSVILNATTLKDGIVGLRNRDTTLKEQVHITRLKDTIWRNVNVT